MVEIKYIIWWIFGGWFHYKQTQYTVNGRGYILKKAAPIWKRLYLRYLNLKRRGFK